MLSPVAQPAFHSLRLDLEPLEIRHAALLHPSLSDAELYRFFDREPPQNLEALATRYSHLVSRRSPDGAEIWLNWAVRHRDAAAYIGTVEATLYPNRRANIAYVTFREFWRQGYSKEAIAALIAHLFKEWPVELIEIVMDSRNLASVRLAESVGAKRIEFTPRACFFKGSFSDEYRYELAKNGS